MKSTICGRQSVALTATGSVLGLTLFGLASLAGAPAADAAGAISAAPADGSQGEIGLDPATGRTDLGTVAVMTTEKCPLQTTNYIVRITGAGFPNDNGNATGNKSIDDIEYAPGGTGYFIRLAADLENLGTANNVKPPLNGTATLQLVCGDLYLNKVYATMTG